jgi:type VI secretion system secreted protein Hcp
MAETVHLVLKANGNVIQGESTQRDLGRDKTIECLVFRDNVRTARELGSRRPSGAASTSRSRSSSASTRARRCWRRRCARTRRSRGPFKFYRPSPKGDGTTEQFFTVEIKDGRVDAIERHSPNAIDPAASKAPPLETVRFVYHTIRWVYEPSGAEYVDSWSTSDS